MLFRGSMGSMRGGAGDDLGVRLLYAPAGGSRRVLRGCAGESCIGSRPWWHMRCYLGTQASIIMAFDSAWRLNEPLRPIQKSMVRLKLARREVRESACGLNRSAFRRSAHRPRSPLLCSSLASLPLP